MCTSKIGKEIVFMKKRFISIMLVMLMALSTFGTFVFAEDPVAAPEGIDEAVLDVEEATDETAEPVEEATEETAEPTEEAAEVTEAAEAAEEETLPAEEEAVEEETIVVEPEEALMAQGNELPVTAKYVNDTNSNIQVSWTPEEDVTVSSAVIKVFKNNGKDPVKTVTVTNPATTTKYTFANNAKGNYKFEVTVKGKKAGSDKVDTFSGSAEASSPGSIVAFNTYSAYNRVVVEWNKPAASELPDRYEIYCDGKRVRTFEGTMPPSPFDNAKKYYYYINHPDDASKFVNGKEKSLEHSYYIKAIYGDIEVKSATKKDTVTLPFKIKLTFKSGQSGTLKSHDGKNKKFKYSGGKVVYATSFARGQYHFYNNGNLFYVNYTRVTPKATLNGRNAWNYSSREAQYFLNTLGTYSKSSSNRLIYVNLYTQHLYVACKKSGKWVVQTLTYNGKKFREWEISSGKPTIPSPWGLGLKYSGKLVNIYTHSRKVNGHTTNYWNFYHSETALHGRADNQGYGAPFSHGCIRNPDYRASFILKKIPLKTRVVIY